MCAHFVYLEVSASAVSVMCVCVSRSLLCCWTCRMCVEAQRGTICCLDSGASHHGGPMGEQPQLLLVSPSISSRMHHQTAGVEITQIHSPHACFNGTVNNSSYRFPLAKRQSCSTQRNCVQLKSCRGQSLTT